jgi:hypothetical protein
MDQSGRQSAIGTYFSSGSTDSRIDFYVSNGNTDGSSNNRMSIMGSGNVGIGTSSPTQILEVKTSSLPTIELNQADTYRGAIRLAGNDLELRNSSGVIDFFVGTNNDHESNSTRAMMIDNSGKVLVGTSTPASFSTRLLTVGDTSFDDTSLEIRSSTGTTGRLYFTDASDTSTGAYKGAVVYDQASDFMRFETNGGNERMRILSGGGITFNGDTAQDNALDDYEEGTWTPSVSQGTLSGTSPSLSGRYIKIGDFVSIKLTITNSAGDLEVGSYVGISGVPFSFSESAQGVVLTEDIDVFARQGFASCSGTNIFLSACGSSSGTTALLATVSGRI